MLIGLSGTAINDVRAVGAAALRPGCFWVRYARRRHSLRRREAIGKAKVLSQHRGITSIGSRKPAPILPLKWAAHRGTPRVRSCASGPPARAMRIPSAIVRKIEGSRWRNLGRSQR
jgi:hypothetical protein